MTSIDFGLTIAAYGALSVFVMLLLVIVFIEVLKRGFKDEAPDIESGPKETDVLVDEELAAVSAAVAFYTDTPPASIGITDFKSSQTPTSRWSHAGRMEIMNKRLRG